jgi:hypothetical protein
MASACAALKHMLSGDHAPMGLEEVERVMAGAGAEIRR